MRFYEDRWLDRLALATALIDLAAAPILLFDASLSDAIRWMTTGGSVCVAICLFVGSITDRSVRDAIDRKSQALQNGDSPHQSDDSLLPYLRYFLFAEAILAMFVKGAGWGFAIGTATSGAFIAQLLVLRRLADPQ